MWRGWGLGLGLRVGAQGAGHAPARNCSRPRLPHRGRDSTTSTRHRRVVLLPAAGRAAMAGSGQRWDLCAAKAQGVSGERGS